MLETQNVTKILHFSVKLVILLKAVVYLATRSSLCEETIQEYSKKGTQPVRCISQYLCSEIVVKLFEKLMEGNILVNLHVTLS